MRNVFHAYILIGSEEETTEKALELAQAANCNDDGLPCGFCDCCRRIREGSHPDLFHVFPDGSSIKIEKIRNVILSASQPPIEGRRKIYVIHEAGKMTQDAQNTLLKTLEDPPTASIFLLLTQNIKNLLPTVVSRCQILDYSKLDESEIPIPGDVKETLMDIIFSRPDLSKIHFYVQKLTGTEIDPDVLMEFMAGVYRDLLVIKTKSRASIKNREFLNRLKEQAAKFSPRALVAAIDTLYSQIEAVKSRGNANLVWFNLLLRLQEQEVI